ncbi:MAG: class I SAM-dependent DNA methyltransferase [Acidimicrobiia bacterium]
MPVTMLAEPEFSVADVATTFDALADTWDTYTAARGHRDPRPGWARRLESAVLPREPVVELGCGTGVPVGWLLAERYRYIGVDVSRRMVARAGDVMPTAAFTCADMTGTEFPADSLGGVVAFGAVAHVPRPRHAELFDAIARWLRPGGLFVGSLTAVDLPHVVEPDWMGAGPMHWSGFDAAANLALLEGAGFELVDHAVLTGVGVDGRDDPALYVLARRVVGSRRG